MNCTGYDYTVDSITSSGAYMYVQYTSTRQGQSATTVTASMATRAVTAPRYYLTSACPIPPTITTSTYTTVSLAAASTYDSGLDCSVVVDAGSPALWLHLSLSQLSVREGVDVLEVRDGAAASSPLLVALTGSLTTLPSTTYVIVSCMLSLRR